MSSPPSIPRELERIVDHLELDHQDGDEFRCGCPVCHSHDNLSIRWNPVTKREVVQCWTGCHEDWATLAEALRKRGCVLHGDFAKYTYTDEGGKPLYRVNRRPDPDSGERRKWMSACIVHRNGVPEWVSKRGCMQGVRRVLYNLPAVREAIKRGDDVWLVEGEPAADALIREGQCATTNANGAKGWRGEFTDALKGARLVLSPDKDRDGYRGMLKRYQALEGTAASMRIALAKGKDADDHFSTGQGLWDFDEVSADELEDLADMEAQAEAGVVDSALPRDDPMPGCEMSDIGMAKRYAEVYRDEVCYVPELRQWRVWNGVVWEDVGEETEPLRRAHELSLLMSGLVRDMSESDKEKLQRESPRSLESSRGVFAMLRNAIPYLLVSASAFDTNRKALVLPDCVLVADPQVSTNGNSASTSTARVSASHRSASSLSTVEHSAHFYSTQRITVLRNTSAPCPAFRHLLTTSIPDKGDRLYLQTMLGFGLIGGDRVKKRVVNLIGPKDSGKTTLLIMLHDVLGDYVVTPDADDFLLNRRHSKSEYALHSMRHARIAIITEPQRHAHFDTSALKKLTGGDRVRTRGLYQNSTEWRASVLVLLASNNPVKYDTNDKAFGDRLVPIRFVHPKRDPHLKEALDKDAEREGALRWILRGVERAARGALQEPASIIRGRERYEADIESPLQFVARAVEIGKVRLGKASSNRDYAKAHAFHDRYVAWCAGEGIKEYGFRRFCDVLYAKYPRVETQRGSHFSGIVPIKV